MVDLIFGQLEDATDPVLIFNLSHFVWPSSGNRIAMGQLRTRDIIAFSLGFGRPAPGDDLTQARLRDADHTREFGLAAVQGIDRAL